MNIRKSYFFKSLIRYSPFLLFVVQLFQCFFTCRNVLFILISFCLSLQGTQFFESLLLKLQDKYSFRLDDYLSGAETSAKMTAYTAVAILVAQKIYLFLGDLARYREQANETSSYGKARQ